MNGCCFIDSLCVVKSAVEGITGFTTLRLQVKHYNTILRTREHPLDIQKCSLFNDKM